MYICHEFMDRETGRTIVGEGLTVGGNCIEPLVHRGVDLCDDALLPLRTDVAQNEFGLVDRVLRERASQRILSRISGWEARLTIVRNANAWIFDIRLNALQNATVDGFPGG